MIVAQGSSLSPGVNQGLERVQAFPTDAVDPRLALGALNFEHLTLGLRLGASAEFLRTRGPSS